MDRISIGEIDKEICQLRTVMAGWIQANSGDRIMEIARWINLGMNEDLYCRLLTSSPEASIYLNPKVI